ncbi:u3-Nephitoxin-Nsp1a_1 [Trichonephila inaurata madagascariensis]|uniref:U3-Nephitoxin-Nsp1a_1 n=1 Tax=Trichonephila inaurata madagascariensis TaxID=2747483 RepID=A0A8X7CP91_9ARAC|nr:u3-Nephitoxin-Nsp1a_1 [Trichonephila inaurata madagascariensis]
MITWRHSTAKKSPGELSAQVLATFSYPVGFKTEPCMEVVRSDQDWRRGCVNSWDITREKMSRFSVVMCFVYGLLVLCIAAADARATENISESVTDQNILANNSCEDVRQVYVEKNIGTEKDASDMTHEGKDIL